jgi:ribose transport system permease protein
MPNALVSSAASGLRNWVTSHPYFRKIQSVIGLILIVLLALLFSPHSSTGGLVFIEAGNITDILRQVSEIGIISLGMTFVILTGGIDLSVGSTLALSSSIIALILTHGDAGNSALGMISIGVAAALGGSLLIGLINGFVIAKWRVQPFIVTLATMIGIRGLARWLTSNSNIDIGFGRDLAALFAQDLSTKVVVIGSYAGLSVVLWALFSKTVFGRHVRAIGDNEKAAIYAGLPSQGVKVLVYGMAGVLAGYSGVLHAAQNHQGSPNAGIAYELEAIAAVVIGGTNLAGGQGSIGGTVVGTLIMGVLTNILRLNNIDSNLEMMLKAVIIIAAVWIQQRGRDQT